MFKNDDEWRQGLIDLYMDQLQHKSDTTFMKCVLMEAVRRLHAKNSNPKKIENWVVARDKETLKF